MSKWISRKLFIAVAAVAAIGWGIHKGSPEAEGQVMSLAEVVADGAIALISAAYIFAQGRVDAEKEKAKQ